MDPVANPAVNYFLSNTTDAIIINYIHHTYIFAEQKFAIIEWNLEYPQISRIQKHSLT